MFQRKERREPWKLPYLKRTKVSKKFKETEKAAREAKSQGRWYDFAKIKLKLRKVWWGIKRYK
ncbi:MAG: hypothetical protein EBY39_06805 [Flavobacteriia bacterium]|nr:hypothetical protein [Flavobacteriia bacterium]